ncbi:MAG: peptide ABC transporter permease [Ignavibacteria bacterium]|nr:MAG: peptide ABC transporter permease [Ignavibacteria bacterium]
MHLGESISTTWQTLRGNKLRAFLTLLSIAIGVFSIIFVMTSLGALQNSIEGGLSALGSNTFQVQKYANNEGGGPGWHMRTRNRQDLTYAQGLKVLEGTTGAKHIGLEVWKFGVEVRWRNVKTNPDIFLAGETPGGLPTNQWDIDLGRGIMQSDLDLNRKVVVLGSELVRMLFPPSYNPVGKTVSVGGRRFKVIGTLEAKGGLFGNQDKYFIIPITTFFEAYGRRRSIHIMVQARSRENFEQVQDEVIGILRAARDVPPGEENDFALFSNESVIRQFNEATGMVRIGTLAIAGVALLAAGIGIMNIMLVSVTERTREIGIRKAVGATRGSIVSQFLSEAVVITILGGLIGIVFGLLAGNILAVALEIDPVIQFGWIGFGIAACVVVGVSFGTYPAWKASNLDPIDALHYE